MRCAPHTASRELFSVELLFCRCVISHVLWALAVNSAVVKTTAWPVLMLARPFDQLDQDHVTGPAETNPLHILRLPLASLPSFWFDYLLKFQGIILILVKAERSTHGGNAWSCWWGEDKAQLTIYGLCHSLAEAARQVTLPFIHEPNNLEIARVFCVSHWSCWQALSVDTLSE